MHDPPARPPPRDCTNRPLNCSSANVRGGGRLTGDGCVCAVLEEAGRRTALQAMRARANLHYTCFQGGSLVITYLTIPLHLILFLINYFISIVLNDLFPS